MKKKFLKELKKIKCYYFVKEAVSIRGIPDVIVCHKGLFWGIELKRDIGCLYYKRTKKLRIVGRQVLQYSNLQKIINSGGCGVFCYPQNMVQVIEHIKKGKFLEIPKKMEE